MRQVLIQILLLTSLSSWTLAEDNQYFERKIRPLLSKHCYACHSAEAKPLHGGLRLETDKGVKQGGDSGPVLSPGKPDESLLIEAIRYKGDIQMPPEGKLSDTEIAELVRWVREGAPMPASPEPAQKPSAKIDFEAGRKFWSFQPVKLHPQSTGDERESTPSFWRP
jgi:hypothetical protein